MCVDLYKEQESVDQPHPKDLVWLRDESVGKDLTLESRNSG